MRFSTAGIRGSIRRPRPAGRDAESEPGPPLTVARVGLPRTRRVLGRRDVALAYNRVIIPSLVIDHSELRLRQRGVAGHEGFLLWAGSLAGGDAFVSTIVTPGVEAGRLHGQVSPQTAARAFDELDHLDLVPIAQVHTHPEQAFLSATDAQRPMVAADGFLSIVIPSFGFVDLADVGVWRAYEFHGREQWRELSDGERSERLIVDPSLITIS